MASSYRMRASTSDASASEWKYDVFLSFSGEDTRYKFTDRLYKDLQRPGINAFRDDPQLERGASISLDLLAAIEESRFAVVVLSPNYASSTWCLLELATIVQCMGERGGILPIFYEVKPSDVKHQTGSFADAFSEHENKFGKDSTEVKQWRDAFTKVADIAGWTFNNDRPEADIIEAIVEKLSKEVLASSESESFEHLVGIEFKLKQIDLLLEAKASDVCFIGIWGMGGIGKTTLAARFYQRYHDRFDVRIFLAKVRETCATHGLDQLQEELLFQISNEKIQVRNAYDGRSKTKRRLCNKKVLLVLDDVDHLDQLENLAGGKDWFGSESRIIVTTRDERLLVSHDIEIRYESKGLNKHEALQLFSRKAFKKNHPKEGYKELSQIISDYAGGLPLALKILGSSLYERDRGIWEGAVYNLQKARTDQKSSIDQKLHIDQELFETLRISCNGLKMTEQQVFLDVACFLKGNDRERVVAILYNIFGYDTGGMIDILVEKSLLTIYDNCVEMHDLIQAMGWEIVRLESMEEPGKRSRLWLRDDILCVLKENEGTKKIRSIALCLPKLEEWACNPNAFSKMSKLKFLKLHNLVLCQGLDYLPDSISVLEWTSYPSKSLPPNFHPVELIELILHQSNIEKLWDGIKFLEKLTLIDLSYSEYLIMTPDFTGIQNLERLVLEGCTNLVDIHSSITSLRRLKVLNLKNCRSIKSLPNELEMDSLEIIDFSGCSKVNIFPQFVARMEKLLELSFSGIGTQNFEVSCHSVSPHPLSLVLGSLKHLCSLKRLNLNDCKLSEGAIADDIGCLSSLEELDVSVNDFVSLPATINRLSNLKRLNLTDCKRLEQLPDLPLFSCTCYVAADNCISLKKLPEPPAMSTLWNLSFSFINCCSISIEDEGFCSAIEDEGFCSAIEDEGIEDDGQGDGVSSGSDDGDIEDDAVSSYIIYSMLRRFLQEPPRFETFSIVIPGNDIPVRFRDQSVGASVRMLKTDCSFCRSNSWVGLALCVLFGPEENLDALGEDPDLKPHANTISCSWTPVSLEPARFTYELNKVVKSDHLCVFLLPRKYFQEKIYAGDTGPSFTDFLFEADPCLKVKKCGVRTLYKQDVIELNARKNHGNKSISAGEWYSTPQESSPLSDEVVSTLFPENDIPWLFTNTSKGDSVSSVSQELPCSLCSGSWKWIGFAVCALFGAAALGGEDHDLEPHANKIFLNWRSAIPDCSRYMCDVERVELSDQLCVFFVPMNKFIGHSEGLVKFVVGTRGAACLEVKRCGVRTLYMKDVIDVIESNITMDQYLRSMSSFSLETDYEID